MKKKIFLVVVTLILIFGVFCFGRLLKSNSNSNVVYNKLPEVIGPEGYNGYETYNVLDESLIEDMELEEVTLVESNEFDFIVEDVSKDIVFGTPWKCNDKGDMALAIEGRGKDALTEGEGFIYLKSDNGIKSIKLSENGIDYAPVYVEWYSDDSFLLHLSNRIGNVFTGGKLYLVNVNEMKPLLLYEANKNEEITEASRISADIVNVKILKHKEEAIVSSGKNIIIK